MHDANGNGILNDYAQTLVQLKVRQLCRRAGFNRSDVEDLKQEIFLYLLSQADRFDPGRASLNTFIGRVVNSYAAMLLRQRRRIKHGARFQALSLESTMLEVDGIPTPAREAISEKDLHRRTGADSGSSIPLSDERMILDRVIRSLSPELQDVSHRLTYGTVTSVARDLDVSRRQVHKAVRSIRWQFQLAKMKKSKKSGHLAEKRHK